MDAFVYKKRKGVITWFLTEGGQISLDIMISNMVKINKMKHPRLDADHSKAILSNQRKRNLYTSTCLKNLRDIFIISQGQITFLNL